jgi:hypothetical protein
MNKVVQYAEAQPALNPVQLRLLKVFSNIKQEKHMEELNELLLDFYR